jgi:hypothetical protein
MVLRNPSLLRNRLGLSEVISSVILTSVMLVIIITSSHYANDTINYNVESVQFDQAINAILSLDRMAKKIMFNPKSTASVKTSFQTTTAYFVQEGNLAILVDEDEIASIPVNTLKVEGGSSVGGSFSYSYVGNDTLLLAGIGGSISHVKKYWDLGAWASIDFQRIRCIYCGEMDFYNGTNPEPTKRNVVEITVIRLSSGEISPLERSRIIIENTGIQTQQIEQPVGDFTIRVQFPGMEEPDPLYLTELGGNATLSTLINLTVIDLKITILGGG